ncbi:flavin-containing monooxygenase [Prescottella equi]|uniref:flavin-containing monooxygenase n=1 Tax=Rhodococcus hoagii TaxID=43767 RepID=UPI000A11DC56|nr:NAD(P)/FAD-dependent oxidoreductase [Prescottella equi]
MNPQSLSSHDLAGTRNSICAKDVDNSDAFFENPVQRTEAWLTAFEQALSRRDVARATDLFATESYWRDLLTFTWDIQTVEHRDGVQALLAATLANTSPSGFRLMDVADVADGVITAVFSFETAIARGDGVVRLVREHGKDRAYTLFTSMTELRGYEEPRGARRPMGTQHAADRERRTWLEVKRHEEETLGVTTQPFVLVIGGGQSGIVLGARLRQLGVPALVVDRQARPGDQWRNRYKSLCLHDPVWANHLPYIPFPDTWPVFTPKDRIGDWLDSYVTHMEVPYWSSTEAVSARWSAEDGEWCVDLVRDGVPVAVRPTHLVLATGMSGRPRIPDIAGRDAFRGEVQHSSEHPGPDAYGGKRVVVVGSNNSAFDICGALWEQGAEVTMVQRSSTLIVRSRTLIDTYTSRLYSERALAAGITTERADLLAASIPYRVMPSIHTPVFERIAEVDRDFYTRLTAAGFWLDWGEDGSGMMLKYLRRASGYYIDVGSAELVADGRVALAHGQASHLTEDALLLDDGTELPADLVVFATGYESMTGWVSDLIGEEAARRLGPSWGLGSDTTNDPGPWEGELRNMWKPTSVDNLWMHGGNLQQVRLYSRVLALQLKARFERLDTPVYR